MRTYRATVRGRFDGLSPEDRDRLLGDLDAHDALYAAFTTDGTFTYDRSLSAFSFRFLLEDEVDDAVKADASATTVAELRAIEWLEEQQLGYQALRVELANIEDMKASTRRLRL
jgi:hypothetical protein